MGAVGAFFAVLIIGALIYTKIWWEGIDISYKFTKWYFALSLVAALITGVSTFILS